MGGGQSSVGSMLCDATRARAALECPNWAGRPYPLLAAKKPADSGRLPGRLGLTAVPGLIPRGPLALTYLLILSSRAALPPMICALSARPSFSTPSMKPTGSSTPMS